MDKYNEEVITAKIKAETERIALFLMNHENKDFCLAGVSHLTWRLLRIPISENNYRLFVVVPSPVFKRIVLDREYIKTLDQYPDAFGHKDDWAIVSALRKTIKSAFPDDYTDEQYLEYLCNESMAYVFEIIDSEEISDKVLRLDLCRGIKDKKFLGGFFHILKHFTIEGYDTISHNKGEYLLEIWAQIYSHLITNFFSDNFVKEEGSDTNYISKSELKDGRILRGVYYKEDGVPVYFVKSMRIDKKK